MSTELGYVHLWTPRKGMPWPGAGRAGTSGDNAAATDTAHDTVRGPGPSCVLSHRDPAVPHRLTHPQARQRELLAGCQCTCLRSRPSSCSVDVSQLQSDQRSRPASGPCFFVESAAIRTRMPPSGPDAGTRPLARALDMGQTVRYVARQQEPLSALVVSLRRRLSPWRPRGALGGVRGVPVGVCG